jgi:hypothetical protein
MVKGGFKNLCRPAFIYLFISVIGFIVGLIVQQFVIAGNTNRFIVFAEAIFILFWTFILNSICKAGYPKISWILLILPILGQILGLILLASVAAVKGSAQYSTDKRGEEDADKPNN